MYVDDGNEKLAGVYMCVCVVGIVLRAVLPLTYWHTTASGRGHALQSV